VKTGAALALSPSRTRTADFLALAKPRLNLLVVLTTLAAFYLGAGPTIDLAVLVHTVIGTALVAGAASALNQVYERDVDARMRRTRMRPLPDGRLQPVEAVRFGMLLALVGLVQLAAGANLLASLVAFATLASYVAVYTPLKRRTPFATVVGAVPGALPAMIGWAAARNDLSAPAWILAGIVFLWQMPHFLAIAWIYREDYERAGIPLLPVVEPDGRSTARQVVLYGAALWPVSLMPALLGLSSAVYLWTAAILSGAFLFLALRFARQRNVAAARRLFLGSIIYLPLLWIVMIIG
jgi:protoheme IX farnesyltransferase